jgi:nitrate/nitrite transport system substrate-binding protein
VAKKAYRPDSYVEAAKTLVAEKKANAADFDFTTDSFRAPTKEFIDGIEYDGRKPNAYIEKLRVGLKGQQKIENGDVVGK